MTIAGADPDADGVINLDSQASLMGTMQTLQIRATASKLQLHNC